MVHGVWLGLSTIDEANQGVVIANSAIECRTNIVREAK